MMDCSLTYFLVEGQCGPLPLGQRECHSARADVLISLDGEDKMLTRSGPHVNVGTSLTIRGIYRDIAVLSRVFTCLSKSLVLTMALFVMVRVSLGHLDTFILLLDILAACDSLKSDYWNITNLLHQFITHKCKYKIIIFPLTHIM